MYADPVDEDLSDPSAAEVDVIVAASRTAADAYRRCWPRARAHAVDHHVDPRVLAMMQPTPAAFDEVRFGYFGERLSTIRSRRIARRVDFIDVSTARADDSWFPRLRDYNAHYGVR